MLSKSAPLVSIALCTFNGEKHLREQLDSLVNQSYPNLEIIIVDDCSLDETPKILDDYKKQFASISVFYNERNLGYVKNFEQAIRLSKGEYIALCDQDDIWRTDKIQIQINGIGDHALSYHDSELIDEDGSILGKYMSNIFNLYEGKSPHPFLFFNCVSGHSLVFHRRLLPDILPLDESYFHDWWIALLATERGGITLAKGNLVKYRQHPNSSTDILRARTKEAQVEKFFTTEKLRWIRKFAEKSVRNRTYCEALLNCFDAKGQVKNKFKLLYLFLLKYDSILYVIKKSSLSKLNFVRKICLQRKYSEA
ncbi:glycosyltransferase family 2 protein [Pedobacter sp. SAFR-022]|uniref:glycosyltransferase family 2 protein n=1 Tax=Pedobacter sp. SAFR-022 TaxID=3436861 RepID=UPI003F7DC4A8